MTKATVLGLVRHVLTFAGGIAVSKGILDDTSLLESIGAVMTIIGTVWSVIEKRPKA